MTTIVAEPSDNTNRSSDKIINKNVKSFRIFCNESNNSGINNWFSNVGLSYFDRFIEYGNKFYAYIYV